MEALAEASRGEPQRAFVSASMRPYLLAALLEADPEQPALVVAGDDRAARDLAADMKQFLSPRPVHLYPARGVQYESHLAPPPHLVGLRIAALDALREGAAVVVASAGALAEKVPDPDLRPHGFQIEKGELLDIDETAQQLVAAGYEHVDQVEERGQFAQRGDIVDIYPATEERAVRCELFDVEVERLTFFSTFTQRSLEEVDRVSIEPAAELAPEHRELAEIAAASEEDDRPDVAELLPVDRFCEVLDLLPDDALVAVAAEEELEPALNDLWEDVTASFHDADAHHLYVSPGDLSAALERAPPCACRASRATSRTSSAPRRRTRRRARCATPSPSSRSWCARAIAPWWRGPGRGRRSAPPTTWTASRPRSSTGRPAPHEPGLSFAAAALRDGFVSPQMKVAIIPEHRLLRRRRAEQPPARAPAPARWPASRTCARARPWCTRTTASACSPASRPRRWEESRATTWSSSSKTATGCSCRATSSTRSAATWAPTPATRRCPSSAASSGSSMKLRARRAAEALAGELINLYAERKRRSGHAFPADGEWQVEFEASVPVPRDARPARGDRGRARPTWRRRGRWTA